MAQDTGSQESSKPQEVNLDELEVVILILGKNASSLNQAGAFLTRRGWPTTVMTNMSKAVEHIAEKKPDFVLVSFNHPNPAVMKLPELITQTFNLTCVGFIENLDAGSSAKLNNYKMRYKIQGMPSGPNLQRSIRKILAEKFNIKTDDDKRQESARERDGNTVTVKGSNKEGGAASGGTIVQSGAKGPSSQQKGAHMVKGGEGAAATYGSGLMQGPDGESYDGDHAETEGDSITSGKYKMSKPRKSLKDLQGSLGGDVTGASEGKSGNLEALKKSLFGEGAQDSSESEDELQTADTKGGGSVAAAAAAAAKAAQDLADQEAAARNPTDAYYANARKKSDGSEEGESSQSASAAKGGSLAAAEAAASAAAMMAASQTANAAKAAQAAQAAAVAASVAAAEAAKKAAHTLADMSPAQVAALPPQQLLERAVASAMHRICQRTPNTITRELGMLSKVAVFPIESATLPGYLVVGMEQDANKIEDFFLKTCETALREELSALKVPAVLESGFWIHVPEVHFHIWTGEKGSFKVVLPHEEGEIGIGYFPIAGGVPRGEVYAENKDMLKVAIDDISTEQPINFKAYLHMKKNKKYFLYLRNGRQLQKEQKARLKTRQVTNIFMKTVEAENLRMYLAASFLRDTMKKVA
ncbi:MAG: hypothetical protein KF799_02345 [Bdellovibrionales bacterium]|nr:hypothetical protein [Bdellovibrionales bacterium]